MKDGQLARQRMLFASRHNMQEDMLQLADDEHVPQLIPTGSLVQPAQRMIRNRDCRSLNQHSPEIHQ